MDGRMAMDDKIERSIDEMKKKTCGSPRELTNHSARFDKWDVSILSLGWGTEIKSIGMGLTRSVMHGWLMGRHTLSLDNAIY